MFIRKNKLHSYPRFKKKLSWMYQLTYSLWHSPILNLHSSIIFNEDCVCPEPWIKSTCNSANSYIQFTRLPTQTVQKCLYFPYWILREVPVDRVKIKHSMTQTNMPKWTEESPQGFSPIWRTIGNWGKMGTGEVDFTKLVFQCQAVNPQNIYTGIFIWTYQVIFRNIYIYAYVKKK